MIKSHKCLFNDMHVYNIAGVFIFIMQQSNPYMYLRTKLYSSYSDIIYIKYSFLNFKNGAYTPNLYSVKTT